MSVKNIVEAALEKARGYAGGVEKTASTGQRDLTKEAHQAADALEYLALEVVDDGSAAGTASRRVVEDFFKRAEKGTSPGETISPTGTQTTPPQAGSKKILPTGLAKGNSPAESGAPTGTQATIGQPPHEKKGDGPMTLLDILTKNAESPVQSVALQDSADPGRQNENANVKLLESEQAIVNATKRDAKMPTRARLKTLFASASDTGPSSAAAQAAFPNAYAKGGMKVAEAEEKCEKCKKESCECPPAKEAGHEDAVNRAAKETTRRQAYLTGDHAQETTLAGHGAGAGAVQGALGGAIGGGRTVGRMGGVVGGLAGLGRGLAKGKGGLTKRLGTAAMQTATGAMTGMGVGTLAGGAAGAAPGAVAGAVTGARRGAAEGAAYNKDRHEARAKDAKEASLSDYALFFDKAASGELGDEARVFAEYIEGIQF